MNKFDEYKKNILKGLERFAFIRSPLSVFKDAVEYNAWNVAIHTLPIKQEERLQRMREIVKGYENERDKEIFRRICNDMIKMLSESLDNYGDHLGEMYMELAPKNKHAGQYFTPYHVSLMCAKMTIGAINIQDKDVITFNEPACGSGGMMVAAAETLKELGINYTMNAVFVAADIDRFCVLMCYLQTSFIGLPAIIQHQNTITMECWDSLITPAFALQYFRFMNALKGDKK